MRQRGWIGVIGLAVGLFGCQADDPEDAPLEDMIVDGLDAPVEIVVDSLGIPHIYAQTDADLMYAAGYQMASDRLFQLDLMRRRAMGTRSAVLGEAYVESDRTSRIFDFHRWGAANSERLEREQPELHALLEAWLAGVNRRIEQVRSGEVELPYGFGPGEANYMPEPMTAAEHSAVSKLLMFGNSNSLERELLATIVARTFPDAFGNIELARPAFDVTTMPLSEVPAALERGGATPSPGGFSPNPAAPYGPPIDATPEELQAAVQSLHRVLGDFPKVGSNNWAIDGRHTQSGRPLIAGDPHQELESPSLMFTQHLNSADAGGNYDVIGWSFVGAAGIHLGHNQKIHWTATTNFADVMDVWEVALTDGGAQVGAQVLPVVERTEVIEVAGSAPTTIVARDIEGFGVLLPPDLLPVQIAAPGNALLLNWTGFTATNEEASFFGMNTAQTIEEYEAAVDLMEVGGFNFVSADADEISYRVSINVPDRGPPSARQMPFLVVDGNDESSYWNGFLPPERLPRSRAETEGWVATANNDPFGFTFDGDVSNDPWYYGYFFAAGHRAQRLFDELTELTAAGNITMEQMQALQTDPQSALAPVLAPVLAEAWANTATDPELERYANNQNLQTLVSLISEQWDHQMTRESSGALAFHVWMLFLTEEAIGDDLSLLYTTVLNAEPAFVIKLPALAVTGEYPRSAEVLAQGRDVAVLEALSRTAQFLSARFGGVDPSLYTWGDLHGTQFDNQFGGRLDGPFVPTVGGEDTINVSSSQFVDTEGVVNERFASKAGAIFRVVTQFAEDGTPEAFANFPPGNSGNPDSPHFADTLDDWVEGRYQPLPYRREDVDAAQESTSMLDPADHPGLGG